MNLKNIRKQISEFREELSAFIDTLPDGADGVQFLDKEKKCAQVSFSTIAKHGGILSAGHYLNRTAKDEMKRIIKVTKLENLDTVIEKIIQTGSIPASSGSPVKANPQFIAKLKEMWEGERNEKND